MYGVELVFAGSAMSLSEGVGPCFSKFSGIPNNPIQLDSDLEPQNWAR